MKQITQCSICNHPHCADIFTLQMTFANNTGVTIDSIRKKKFLLYLRILPKRRLSFK